MQDAAPSATLVSNRWASALAARTRAHAAALTDCGAAIISSVLLILSFPDFDLWPLAWLGLVPLLVAIAGRPSQWRAFFLGWLMGVSFFYASCHWVTYSMIHYGGIA